MNPLSIFWGGLLILCLVWYTFVTIYVAIRGVFDIRQMLSNLSRDFTTPQEPE